MSTSPVTTRTLPLQISSSDDPKVMAEQQHDDYANHVVPLTMRVGRWQLSMSFWSLMSAMVWLFYGALASSLFGSINAIVGIVLAVILYSITTSILAKWSMRTGLNAMLLSRQAFGILGATLGALLLAANTVYYAVFESSTLAVAFSYYTPNWDIRIWYAIVAVAMIPLMLGGVQTFMAKLNGILLPFFFLGIIATVIATAVRYPVGTAWLEFPGIVPDVARAYPGWILTLMLYMGLFILLPTAADFARFGRIEDEKFHTVFSFGWVFQTLLLLLNGIVGMFIVRSVIPDEPAAETGVVLAILSSLGVAGLIFIVLSQTRINTLNYYEASANLSRVITSLTGFRVPRLALVFVLTAIVFGLMLTNVFSYLERMLGWQAAFMVGWAGVMLAHYAIFGGWKSTEFRAQRIPAVTPGLFAWLISAAVAIAVEEIPGVPGKISALAPLIALVVSVGLYALAVKVLPRKRSLDVSDPRQEVTDTWSTYVKCEHCEKSYVAYEMDRNAHSDNHHPICDACAVGNRARHFD